MAHITPKSLMLCVALVIGPPALLMAWNYREWFAPKPIDPRLAEGQVLFFEANWCGACRSMKPVVKQIRGEGFNIRTMDVDSHKQQAVKYNIHSIPTFVLVREGEEVRRASGAISPESLRQMWR